MDDNLYTSITKYLSEEIIPKKKDIKKSQV